MTLLGVIAFIVALLVSVLLHEAGHFVMAKRFGMKVPQFFVGFGPTLWSRRKGETEYGVKALPLGGYVKITGMTPLEDVPPGDEGRAFYRQPGLPRAIVLAAGSFTHFIIAFVVLLVVAMGIGLPDESKPTLTVGVVSPCLPSSQGATCTDSDEPSPAARAGLRPGDTIVAFDGKPVKDWDELANAIERQGSDPVTFTVVRDGERIALHTTLAHVPGRQGTFLGISPTVEATRLGPVDALRFSGQTFENMIVQVGRVLGALPSAIPTLFTEERGTTPGNSVGSIVGAAQVSGQVFTQGADWQTKITSFLGIVVSLNVFVGIFNLLPLFPLDGGHLAVLCYERARAGVARLRGRPDPGVVDMQKLMPVTYLAATLVIGLGVLLIIADIVNPISM